MDVFDLVAKITLDQSGYDTGLKQARGKLDTFGGKLKSGLKTAARIGGAAVAAFTAASVAIGKQSLASYADYEQLLGGVETLFGANGKTIEEYAASVGKSVDEVRGAYDSLIAAQDEVLKNANNAYQTMGMSANEYMETVTGFAAALNQSLGGDTLKAADYANKAITDMADNASKMGTDIGAIQTAYQGFAKQNYTMLDNLKLGYGGTKEEMDRLIRDAERMDKTFKVTHKKTKKGADDISYSYADIVDAIHIVQKQMGISGNAAEEASKTISGSLASVKASWSNLLTGMADDNADIDTLIENFINSVQIAAINIMPRIQKILDSLITLIVVGTQELFPKIIQVIIDNLPTILEGGTKMLVALIEGLVAALPILVEKLPEIVSVIVTTLKENWPNIKAAGIALLKMLWNGIKTYGPILGHKMVEIWDKIKASASAAWENIKSTAVDMWGEIKDSIATAIEPLKNKLGTIWDGIKTKISSAIESIKSKVESLKSKFEGLKTKLETIASRIKNLFNFQFTMPKIKLPHFSIDPEGWSFGDLLKGVIPTLSIKWYKKAYDNPYMFTKPTVVAGFGDGKGGEIVYGRENLMRDIREAAGGASVTINVYPQKGQSEEEIARNVQKLFVQWNNQRKAALA